MECKADHSFKKKEKTTKIESAIHNQILNYNLAIVSCVYEPLLQPGVLSLHSSKTLLVLTDKSCQDWRSLNIHLWIHIKKQRTKVFKLLPDLGVPTE